MSTPPVTDGERLRAWLAARDAVTDHLRAPPRRGPRRRRLPGHRHRPRPRRPRRAMAAPHAAHRPRHGAGRAAAARRRRGMSIGASTASLVVGCAAERRPARELVAARGARAADGARATHRRFETRDRTARRGRGDGTATMRVVPSETPTPPSPPPPPPVAPGSPNRATACGARPNPCWRTPGDGRRATPRSSGTGGARRGEPQPAWPTPTTPT